MITASKNSIIARNQSDCQNNTELIISELYFIGNQIYVTLVTSQDIHLYIMLIIERSRLQAMLGLVHCILEEKVHLFAWGNNIIYQDLNVYAYKS